MSLQATIQTLKAAADPTRVRLIALLAIGEATVGELQQILAQSQPRVSRHLRLLDEAGLVTKFRDGQWSYYRLANDPRRDELTAALLKLAGNDDETLICDRQALSVVKRERERDVHATRLLPGPSVGARPAAIDLADALDEVLGDALLGDILDVGCGSGALLCLLGARARLAVGVDVSKRMRLLARSRVHRSGLATCTVRNGELNQLPFTDAAFDVVVLDEVLGVANDPLAGLREASRVVRPAGQLLIIDRVKPVARQLPQAGEAPMLIDNQLVAKLREVGYRVESRTWLPGRVLEYALFVAVAETNQQRTGTHA